MAVQSSKRYPVTLTRFGKHLCNEASIELLHYGDDEVAWDCAGGGSFRAQYSKDDRGYRVSAPLVDEIGRRRVQLIHVKHFTEVLDLAREAGVITADERAVQSVYLLDLA